METDAPGEAWRTTSGAEPGAVKAASPVLNGEDEETGRKALRLVLTQRKLRHLETLSATLGSIFSVSRLRIVFETPHNSL